MVYSLTNLSLTWTEVVWFCHLLFCGHILYAIGKFIQGRKNFHFIIVYIFFSLSIWLSLQYKWRWHICLNKFFLVIDWNKIDSVYSVYGFFYEKNLSHLVMVVSEAFTFSQIDWTIWNFGEIFLVNCSKKYVLIV